MVVVLYISHQLIFENNIPPLLNLNLNLTDSDANLGKKRIFWSSYSILACFYKSLNSFIMLWTRSSSVQCFTRWASEQVYYIWKAIHMELIKWCMSKCGKADKSCIVVKAFWGHNTILWKELHSNKSLLIDNLPF